MNDHSLSEIDVLHGLRSHPQLLDAVRSSDLSELKLQEQLRETYSAELVRAAITLSELRMRAASKFSQAEQMWVDRKGLEQATPELVAQHKAKRFQNSQTEVHDLCCGIGSDTIALASQGIHVTGIDQSPAACLRTKWNAQVYQVDPFVTTRVQDVRSLDVQRCSVHFDPDRRITGKRAVRLEDYSPSLEFMQELTQNSPAGAIKLSPASNFGGKFADCEIELISLNGECKEATVWFGALAGPSPWTATILPAGLTISANPSDFYPNVGELSDYLFDPDPAIVRSGLVDALADQLSLTRLDDAEEYLTADQPIDSPAIATFRVLEVIPNQLKEIGKYFRSVECGELEIKCRHVPVNVDQLRKKLPLHGQGQRTLFIARLQGKTKAVIAQRERL